MAIGEAPADDGHSAEDGSGVEECGAVFTGGRKIEEGEGGDGSSEISCHIHGAADCSGLFATDVDAEGPRWSERHVCAEDGDAEPENRGACGGLIATHDHADRGEGKADDGWHLP